MARYTVQTRQAGLWYQVFSGDTHVATIQQHLNGTRPTGNWTFEIVGRPGEGRKACHRHYGNARAAWAACEKQL